MGLGYWGMSGSYGSADEADSIATLHRSLNLGVNLNPIQNHQPGVTIPGEILVLLVGRTEVTP